MTACSLIVSNVAKSAVINIDILSKPYTVHIGSRVPPVETGCRQVGEYNTDEDNLLNIYHCPVEL